MRLRILTCLVIVGAVLAITLAGASQRDAEASTTWNVGDVFAGVAGGAYNVYDNNGVFKETISNSYGGFTTGCAFNPALDKLYTTEFSATKVVVFDNASPHAVVQTLDTTTDGGAQSESVVFAADGRFFVGHAISSTIHEYDAAGTLIDADTVPNDLIGADWIELASDQTTIFYASEGRNIQRWDSVTDTPLPPFATLPGSGNAFALRLLPPGDGSGGLIVADRGNIKRLDSTGAVVQTYDAAGEDSWFAFNLDPNGTSFWSGDFGTDNLYRFNIASGAVEVGPISTSGGGGGRLFGVCVKGEPTVAIPTTERVTATCDDLNTNALPTVSGANKAFAAEYPKSTNSGNWALWGPNKWWLFAPTGAFTTKSCGLHPNKLPTVTNNRISFVREARLVEFDVLNLGTAPTTISASCDGTGTPTVSQVVAPGATAHIVTSWTSFCLNLTLASSAGKATFDNLVFERPASVGPLVSFNDKAGQNQKLIGQYPVGLIDWGTSATGDWWHSGPFSGFPTKSLSLRNQETQGTFSYVGGDRILISLQLTTGWQASTQTLKCPGNPDVVVNLAPDEYRSVATGWTVPCSAVTIVSSNGWGTNFDNLLLNPQDID